MPEAEVVARSKGEIALAELDRVLAAGVRFGIVLADAGYGASAECRQGLDARGQRWAKLPKVPAAQRMEWQGGRDPAQSEGLWRGRATRRPDGAQAALAAG